MKVVSLLENTTTIPDMEIEHGLSLYIETAGQRILFDMGQTDLFAKNAQKLGIDLTNIDFAVLSHGHYDHGGGLETFFKINHMANVYVTKYSFEPHYHGKEKYIGLDRYIFNKYRDRFIITQDENNLSDKISIFTCNNNPYVYKQKSNTFFTGLPKNKENKCGCVDENLCDESELEFIPDDFRHEQYMLIKEDKEVLFSGCSHKGILNLISWCNPDILIGGFHYKNLDLTGPDSLANKQELDKAAETLLKYKAKYYTCHCTGIPQYEYLKNIMGNRLEYLSTGMTINI